MRTNITSEEFISSSLCIPWATANELAEPAYWSSMMSQIDGNQSAVCYFDLDNEELLQDLQFLWSIALRRRSMAFEEQDA